MAYPPPPGIGNLPAKPPAAKSGFKPAFNAAPQASAPPSSYGAGPSSSRYPPASAAQYGAPSSSYQSYPSGGGVTASAPSSYSYPQQPHHAPGYGAQSHGPQSYGPQTYGPQGYGAAPHIKNPFAATTTGGPSSSDYDAETAAQIAQWQSAYVSHDPVGPSAGGPADSSRPDTQLAAAAAVTTAAAAAHPEKKQTVVREGGGKKWTDDSLLEWDPSHLRLFVGNLAGETTDDSLLKAFARWGSVQRARVIRDKRTSKSKGYGFVSFSDADDFFQAAKEMNGKYIQSHPVVVRKANTEIKVANVKEKGGRGGKKNNYKNNKNNNSNNNKGGNGSGGGAGGYEPNLGPMGGAGVTKPGQRTKNGLKLLG